MNTESLLLQEVRRLLRADQRKDYEIAIEVGTSPGLIYNLRRGYNDSPGVVLVERVYKHLTGKDLEV